MQRHTNSTNADYSVQPNPLEPNLEILISSSPKISLMDLLPAEILLHIYEKLSKKDQFTCSIVSRKWHTLALPILWKTLTLSSFKSFYTLFILNSQNCAAFPKQMHRYTKKLTLQHQQTKIIPNLPNMGLTMRQHQELAIQETLSDIFHLFTELRIPSSFKNLKIISLNIDLNIIQLSKLISPCKGVKFLSIDGEIDFLDKALIESHRAQLAIIFDNLYNLSWSKSDGDVCSFFKDLPLTRLRFLEFSCYDVEVAKVLANVISNLTELKVYLGSGLKADLCAKSIFGGGYGVMKNLTLVSGDFDMNLNNGRRQECISMISVETLTLISKIFGSTLECLDFEDIIIYDASFDEIALFVERIGKNLKEISYVLPDVVLNDFMLHRVAQILPEIRHFGFSTYEEVETNEGEVASTMLEISFKPTKVTCDGMKRFLKLCPNIRTIVNCDYDPAVIKLLEQSNIKIK